MKYLINETKVSQPKIEKAIEDLFIKINSIDNDEKIAKEVKSTWANWRNFLLLPAKKVLQEIEDLNTFYLREGTMKLKNLATSREIKIIVKYGNVERDEF